MACEQNCNKSEYQMVREFHNAFSIDMPNTPTPMTIEQVLNRADFVGEELIEVIHGTAGNLDDFKYYYEEFLKRLERTYQKQLSKVFPDDVLVAQVDAYTDISYFNKGDFTLIGVDPKKHFQIVQNANMGKLHNGAPKYNEYGKIVKPDDWEEKFAPESRIKQEIEHQRQASLDCHNQ